MYDRTSTDTDVDEARRHLFTQKSRALEAIPPTKDALLQHIKRTANQAGHCWRQTHVKQPAMPSPLQWGWTACATGWEPIWMTQPEAIKSCMELLSCTCNNERCQGNCKYFRGNIIFRVHHFANVKTNQSHFESNCWHTIITNHVLFRFSEVIWISI